MSSLFSYVQRNYLPARVKVINQTNNASVSMSTMTVDFNEEISIETTTYPYYPPVYEDNVGYDATGYGDRNPFNGGVMTNEDESVSDPAYNVADESVPNAFGFDYIEQPPLSNIDPLTGQSVSTVSVVNVITVTNTDYIFTNRGLNNEFIS